MAIIDLQARIEEINSVKASLNEKQSLKCYYIDVANYNCLDFLYKQIFAQMNNRLNCVINAAGIFNENQIERTLLVNLGGVINSSLCAMKLMSKESSGEGGIICNIASSAAIDHQLSFIPIYTSTKAAILNFTCSMSVSDGIINRSNLHDVSKNIY